MEICWNVEDWGSEVVRRQRRRLNTEVNHAPDCDGPVACGGTFRCPRCQKLYGWCCGAGEGDERDDYCDGCANAVTCAASDGCDGVLRYRGRPSSYGRCENGCTRRIREVRP